MFHIIVCEPEAVSAEVGYPATGKDFWFSSCQFFFPTAAANSISKYFSNFWHRRWMYLSFVRTMNRHIFFRFHDFFSTFCIVAKKVKLGHPRTKVFCANWMEQRKRPFGIWEVTVEFILEMIAWITPIFLFNHMF